MKFFLKWNISQIANIIFLLYLIISHTKILFYPLISPLTDWNVSFDEATE